MDQKYKEIFHLLSETKEGMGYYAAIVQLGADYLGKNAIERVHQNGGYEGQDVMEKETLFGKIKDNVTQANKILDKAKGAHLPIERAELEKIIRDLVADIFENRTRHK